MTGVAELLHRYRWELTPLMTMAIVHGIVPPLAGVTARGALFLVTALALATMLPAVRRQGRHPLTALWLLVILTTLTDGAGRVAIGLAIDRGGLSTPQQYGLVLSAITIATAAAAIGIAVSQARRGHRFAFLVGAVYLAPTNFLGFVSLGLMAFGFTLPAGFYPPLATLPWALLITSALGLAGVAVAAHAVGHADRLAPSELTRWTAALLGLATFSIWIGVTGPAAQGSIVAGDWWALLWVPLAGTAFAMVQIGIVLALILLGARVLGKDRVANG